MHPYMIYALAVFSAATVSVVAGFGFSTISLTILSLYIPFDTALLIIGILHLMVSVYKTIIFRASLDRISIYFVAGGVVASFIAAQLIGTISLPIIKKCLGVFLMCYPLIVFYRPKFQLYYTRLTALTGGVLSGFLAGLIGMGGAVRSFFLSLFNLPKEAYIGVGGLVAAAIDIARVWVYLRTTTLSYDQILLPLLILIPCLLAGLFIGRYLLTLFSPFYFRMLVAAALSLLGFWIVFFK